MAVTLEWIRDNYDANKDRYIDDAEANKAVDDYHGGKITFEQVYAARLANVNNILLPDYGTYSPTTIDHVISFNIAQGSIMKVDGVEVI